MMGVLAPWLTANMPAIGKSKIAAKEAADVTAGLPAVQAKAGLTSTETKQVTERRKQQQAAFETCILALLGPLQLMATAANDMELLGLATIGRTTFKELRPELQAGVGQQVLAKAKANAKKLEDYAIDDAYLKDAQALADTFQKGLPDTQSLLDARKNANATYEEVHEAQMAQIYELDKAMSVFEAVNPELYRGYKAARALVDSAGGEAKKAENLP
jgi:ribosomal protein L22